MITHRERLLIVALSEILNSVRLITVAHNFIVESTPIELGTHATDIHPALDIFARNIIDSAYSISKILLKKPFNDHPNAAEVELCLRPAVPIRRKLRHIHENLSNIAGSRDSFLFGVSIWYGAKRGDGVWQCRSIFFNGSDPTGRGVNIIPQIAQAPEWITKPQLVIFLGASTINASYILHSLDELSKIIGQEFIERRSPLHDTTARIISVFERHEAHAFMNILFTVKEHNQNQG